MTLWAWVAGTATMAYRDIRELHGIAKLGHRLYGEVADLRTHLSGIVIEGGDDAEGLWSEPRDS